MTPARLATIANQAERMCKLASTTVRSPGEFQRLTTIAGNGAEGAASPAVLDVNIDETERRGEACN